MVIDFSKLPRPGREKPTLVLKNLNGDALQVLGYAKNINAELSYNDVSTLSFDLPMMVDGEITPGYFDVVGMRIIDFRNCGQFLLVDPEETYEGNQKIKTCKAYSLEYEATKKDFFLAEGTYNFWNPLSPNDTVLSLILEKMKDWRLGVIDPDLIGKYRTFDNTSKKVYDFIKSDVQQTYGCIFEFDTYTRTINVVSINSVVPTQQVFLSEGRLVKKLNISEDSDSIITSLDVNGAEGVTIRGVNPTGENKIYNLDYFMNTTNFAQETIDKWHSWNEAYENAQEAYHNLTTEYNLKLMQEIVEQSALVDLKYDLQGQENLLSVRIQSNSKSGTKLPLDDINAEIARIKTLITAQENKIAAIKSASNDLLAELGVINDGLKFEEFFTPDEITNINRYLLEDSLEDTSFVAPSTETYSNVDSSIIISNASFNIIPLEATSADGSVSSGGLEIIKVLTEAGNEIYRISGGKFSTEFIYANSEKTIKSILSGNIIKGTLEAVPDDDTFVFSTYLESGSITTVTTIDGNTETTVDSFENGAVTMTGDYSSLIYSEEDPVSLSMDISEGRRYFSRNTTEYEQHEIEWELYTYGKQVLAEKASPTYTFKVESGNFLSAEDFELFKNELALGKRVYLKYNDITRTPYVVSVNVNFENAASFSIEFGNTYTAFDSSFALGKLLEQSISMGKKLDYKSGIYNQFVSSGASNAVRDFMNSALDIAKNAVLSSGNQAITWDDAGIRIRQWKDKELGTYDDRQIWIVENMIAFTRDNWNTANMAIGEVFSENISNYVQTADVVYDPAKTYWYKSDLNEYSVWTGGESGWASRPQLYEQNHTAYGIVADYIVGTLLAGQNLIIKNEAGSFTVDSTGVYVDSLNFHITHGGSDPTTLDAVIDMADSAIVKVDVYYAQSDSHTTAPASGWITTTPEWEQGKFIWSKTITTMGDGSTIETAPVCITGNTGTNGTDGVGVESITEYYLATIVDAGVTKETSGWTTEIQIIDKDKPFLWNYETVKYSNGESETTDPVIIGHFGINGINGENGAGVESITEYYLATTESSGVTKDDSRWSTSIPTISADAPYLWNKEVITFTKGEPEISEPIVIGHFGTDGTNGTDGVGVDSITEQYILHDSNTTPPSESAEGWSETSPQWVTGKYIWTRSKIVWDDSTEETPHISYTEPVLAATINQIAQDAYNASNKANSVQTALDNVLDDNGLVEAEKIKGVIDAADTQMKSGTGNVLFDELGLWLMNNPSQSAATKAVWLNENGILLGSGDAGHITDDEGDDVWEWTTAITPEGIIANQFVGEKIEGVKLVGNEINGGSIKIGTSKEITEVDIEYSTSYVDNIDRVPAEPDPYYTTPYIFSFQMAGNNPGAVDEYDSSRESNYALIFGDKDYYISRNRGIVNSMAICRIKINAVKPCQIKLYCLNYSLYDVSGYGVVGKLDREIPISYADYPNSVSGEYGNCLYCFGSSADFSQNLKNITIDIPDAGEHFVEVAYVKKGVSKAYNDRFAFAYEILNGNIETSTTTEVYPFSVNSEGELIAKSAKFTDCEMWGSKFGVKNTDSDYGYFQLIKDENEFRMDWYINDYRALTMGAYKFSGEKFSEFSINLGTNYRFVLNDTFLGATADGGSYKGLGLYKDPNLGIIGYSGEGLKFKVDGNFIYKYVEDLSDLNKAPYLNVPVGTVMFVVDMSSSDGAVG